MTTKTNETGTAAGIERVMPREGGPESSPTHSLKTVIHPQRGTNMTDHNSVPRANTTRTSSPGARQRRPILGIAAAAILFIVAGVQYLVVEAIAASAWQTPAYSYASNFISDLGAPDCSTFQGRGVCSPLHTVMNAGFIVQGVLFVVASILLMRLVSGRARNVYLVIALIYGVGMVLVGYFHGSTEATENGTVVYHYIGASMAILGGNVAAIVAGFQWRRLEMPRWFGIVSIVIGCIGLASAVVLGTTFGVLPSGIPERASVYTITAWQTLTGIVLLVGLRRRTRSETNVAN